jgi:hypothetical protein
VPDDEAFERARRRTIDTLYRDLIRQVVAAEYQDRVLIEIARRHRICFKVRTRCVLFDPEDQAQCPLATLHARGISVRRDGTVIQQPPSIVEGT